MTEGSRELILKRLRAYLDDAAPLFREKRTTRPSELMTVAPVKGNAAELAEQFGSSLTGISGSFEIVEDVGEVAARVIDRVRYWLPESGGTQVEALSWTPNEMPIESLDSRLRGAGIILVNPTGLRDDKSRSRAASIDIGITSVDAAFASTGSILLAAGAGKSRAAALLPLHHIALIPLSRIYPTVEAWLSSLSEAGELQSFLRDNGQVAFITGPSKTADIELKLTLGVHGPKEVHAVIFEDG